MVKLAAAIACVAAIGCYDDRYRCTTDSQCDLGEGGRCELDGNCTTHDVTCPTNRRYAEHTGELTATCFDDRVVPTNTCAGGQGPASAEGCIANVCERLPACCALAWTDACVQVAQQECDHTCETRLAITANRGTTTELWDVRWDGAQWSIARRDDLGVPFSWVAPEPGTSEPRLVGMSSTGLVIGDARLAVPPGRVYEAVSSVAFDRDRRLSIAASYTNMLDTERGIEILRLDEPARVRDASVPAADLLTWGDLDRDGFPDAIVKAGTSYTLLENLRDGFSRKLSIRAVANVTGGGTPGVPPLRSIDWLDANRDGNLDLVVFGASVRLHTTPDGLRDVAELELDCAPPSMARSCMTDPEPNLEAVSFVGAALPTAEPSVVFAQFPGRKLYRARAVGDALSVTPLAFPGDGCSCVANCNQAQCPGPSCTCTYDCSACVPVLALVVRDLDRDHRLDLVAIDARLQLFTALAANDFTWGAPVALPTTFAQNFQTVNVSVSGAPSP